jgi:anti-sigma B factor antagonist
MAPERDFDIAKLRDEDGTPVVSPDGELDLSTAPLLLDCLIEVLDAGAEHIVLDMAAVTFVDSAGVDVLLGIQQRARASDQSVSLMRVTTPVRESLRVSRVDTLLGLPPSRRDDA